MFSLPEPEVHPHCYHVEFRRATTSPQQSGWSGGFTTDPIIDVASSDVMSSTGLFE